MAIPKFYLEKRGKKEENINVFYSYNGQRLQYYTGIRIEPKYYNEKCNNGSASVIKSTAPLALQLNMKLNNIKSDVIKIHSKYQANNATLNNNTFKEELGSIYKQRKDTKENNNIEDKENCFISYFQKCIENSENGTRRIKSGKNKGSMYTHNTLKNYKNTLAVLNRFVSYHKIKNTTCDYFNSEKFNTDFTSFCYNVESKEVSTFGGFIKDIRIILKEYGLTPPASMSIPNYESDTIALTEEQLIILHNLDLSNKPYLANARDLFLVGCCTALRYQNYSTLKIENIENNFIRVQQLKTGAHVTIPVMSKLKEIIERNGGNLPKSISNQKLNKYIKEFCEIAGFTHEVEVKNTKGGVTNKEITPFYKLISTHTARRTYATILFKKNVPPMLIMSATGHKAEKSFLKYIRATDESKAQLLAEIFMKIGL